MTTITNADGFDDIVHFLARFTGEEFGPSAMVRRTWVEGECEAVTSRSCVYEIYAPGSVWPTGGMDELGLSELSEADDKGGRTGVGAGRSAIDRTYLDAYVFCVRTVFGVEPTAMRALVDRSWGYPVLLLCGRVECSIAPLVVDEDPGYWERSFSERRTYRPIREIGVKLTQAKEHEEAGRYTEAAKVYGSMCLFDDARRCRSAIKR
jgi:hypothetical protein